MSYLKSLILLAAILFSTGLRAQSLDLQSPIPSHPDLVKGVLDNGLTYYIFNNNKPENRVSFYIYQNVGILLFINLMQSYYIIFTIHYQQSLTNSILHCFPLFKVL